MDDNEKLSTAVLFFTTTFQAIPTATTNDDQTSCKLFSIHNLKYCDNAVSIRERICATQ